MKYRQYLLDNHSFNTVRTFFHPILYIYKYYEIEIMDIPKINKKSVRKPEPIRFVDLPDKEIIRNAVNIASPIMTAVIYFMASSGCARRETLNMTVGDYINALSEYTYKTDIWDIINEFGKENIIKTVVSMAVYESIKLTDIVKLVRFQ